LPERPQVVTFGEMLVRLSPTNHQRLFESEQVRAGFGGAEANVAVALSHLGVRCQYVTRLPDNLIGEAAIRLLRDEGVKLGDVLRGPERMGLYFVEPGADVGAARVVYDRAGSAFANITAHMVDWSAVLSHASWFHGTGITAALGPGPVAALEAAIGAARDQRVPVSLDLNYRPALWNHVDPLGVIAPIVRDIELLIGNAHSVRAMLEVDIDDATLSSQTGARDLAKRLADTFRCRQVALTRREVCGARQNRWSATLYDAKSGEAVSTEPRTVEVVDRIGAGDAFAAALIASLLQQRPLPAALDFAVAASALKVGIPGDFNRATVEQVDAYMRGAKPPQPAPVERSRSGETPHR
jgi:2-dehydro-3-deoxygluconokinase